MQGKGLRCLAIFAVLTGACSALWSEAVVPVNGFSAVTPPDAMHRWIDRPWAMQYIIVVTPTWAVAKKVAVESNAKKQPGRALSWQEIFDPVTTIAFPDAKGPWDKLSVVVIAFDRQGVVTTGHAGGQPLQGRLNELLHVVLSAGNEPLSVQYHLGRWFNGLGDVSTHWAPALCDLSGHRGSLSRTDTGYIYGPKFEISEFGPTFGCREWAYQLYDDERPYIDVTSYVRVGKTYPKHTYINDVIGWARFGDKKPVIGQHEGLWYCLYDCPDGKPAGPIPDIRRWATEKGWRVPRPPTKAPTFPDPPAVQGTYRP